MGPKSVNPRQICCDDDIKRLLEKLNTYRMERDLTLQEIAALLKMSVSQIDLLDNCKVSKPHKRTLYKIKKLLGEI